MEFPFKAVAFDWAHTLVDLGEEDDRAPLEKVFAFLCYRGIHCAKWVYLDIFHHTDWKLKNPREEG